MSYCEYPEFYHETFPRARKPHSCVECAAPIEKGEAHLHYRGKWDGDIDSGRQHMICRELCMYIRDNFQDGECFGFGELHEVWGEMDWSHYPGTNWEERDRKARSLMAQVKWRERRFRCRAKRVSGSWMRKAWGQPWQVVDSETRPT